MCLARAASERRRRSRLSLRTSTRTRASMARQKTLAAIFLPLFDRSRRRRQARNEADRQLGVLLDVGEAGVNVGGGTLRRLHPLGLSAGRMAHHTEHVLQGRDTAFHRLLTSDMVDLVLVFAA